MNYLFLTHFANCAMNTAQFPLRQEIFHQVPVRLGISTVQRVWSSRGAGLGPSIGVFVHLNVSTRK